jgi:hypothetical protein
MSIESLTVPNKYGECAADDVTAIVRAFARYIGRHDVTMELEPRRMITQILRYIALRQKARPYEISNPMFNPSEPEGWNSDKEEIWQDWIDYTFTLESWAGEVMNPIFGMDVRLWEANIEGWREELFHFLPWWIRRSAAIVAKFDPTPLAETTEEEKSNLDPYLLEHGSARQKRMAAKM